MSSKTRKALQKLPRSDLALLAQEFGIKLQQRDTKHSAIERLLLNNQRGGGKRTYSKAEPDSPLEKISKRRDETRLARLKLFQPQAYLQEVNKVREREEEEFTGNLSTLFDGLKLQTV